ncbi:beta-ketoacyl-ACP synthase II [Desulfurispora thermophila]|uniref:beta-ketoacyl-ACP synthase II n=1 Tax=Desulfurispora thermophila TaxID=265470 RepID=UPI0003736294|nr:beta-ketoacyl-ACP synthase II [Desulfurispora thermophila]
MYNRVVVTGIGVVTPLGLDLENFWHNLTAGRSGVKTIDRFAVEGYSTRIAAQVEGFDPVQYIDRKEARRMDRYTQFAMAAAKMARQDAALDLEALDRERAGVILGSGVGGIETLEDQHRTLLEKGPARVSPFFIPMMIANMAAGQIAIHFDLRGVNVTTTSACASSNNAIGDAYRLLRYGLLDVAFTGGAEAPVTPLAVAGFCSMKAMSTRNEQPEKASRPFDAGRDGFVIGEGAAVLVLETLEHARRRGARIYAEVAGYGSTCDAYHITAPEPTGRGAAAAMRLALQDAGVTPEAVDYINAHGTSTPLGDKLETVAIKQVFGAHAYRLAVSSTKSMLGHLLGAAGAVEAVASILAIERGIIPPTINYEEPDPECDLDYVPNRARERQVQVALSNSFGFGGHNATLVFKKFTG